MDRLIFISKEYGELHFEFSDSNLHKSICESIDHYSGRLKFEFSAGYDLSVESNFKPQSKPFFFEWQSIDVHFVPNEKLSSRNFTLFVNGIPHTKSKIIVGRSELTCTINLYNSVGFTDFEIRDDLSRKIFFLSTQVFPQKLDYENDFKEMLLEITEIIYNLVYDFLKRTYLEVKIQDYVSRREIEWIAILKVLYERLEQSLDLILINPHSKLVSTNIIKQVDKVKNIDKSFAKWIVKKQNYLTRIDTGVKISDDLYITNLQDKKKKVTYNTFENRFVLWAAKQILLRIESIKLLVSQKFARDSAELLLNELEKMSQRFLSRLRVAIFYDVDSFEHQFHFSTVLTMAPGYKDFYYRFLLLQKGLSIADNNLFKIDLKEISTLYEYWCFLKTIKILQQDYSYELESNDIIRLEHNRFTVNLKKGKESSIVFKRKNSNEKFFVTYNKKIETPTFNQVPDNYIEFTREGYSNSFKYIIDAKYRFDRGNNDYLKNDQAAEVEFNYGPPLDAIAQLHRYRDAILTKTASSKTYFNAIKSLGGIIVFPYPESETKFKTNRFYNSLSEVNIGAIPLHPGKSRENKLYKNFLGNLIESSPDKLFEETINYDLSDYNRYKKEISSPVLIGLVKSENFEERVKFLQRNKFYYIQKADNYEIAPGKLRYVALYDSTQKIIFKYGSLITDKVEILSKTKLLQMGAGWILTQNEYYGFYVDRFSDCNIPLSRINPKGRRYTNFYSFNKARVSSDSNYLFLINEEQVRIWQEIFSLDKLAKIVRESKYTDELVDKSFITIKFTYHNLAFECKQDPIDTKNFYLNNRAYSLNNDLRSFLLELLDNN